MFIGCVLHRSRCCRGIALPPLKSLRRCRIWISAQLGNGRNTVSRVLFRRRELTEPHWVLGQTQTVSSAKNSVSSLLHTNSRLRGTHWVLSQEVGEGQRTHWVWCSNPCSPKPYSARFRQMPVGRVSQAKLLLEERRRARKEVAAALPPVAPQCATPVPNRNSGNGGGCSNDPWPSLIFFSLPFWKE